MKRRSIMLLSLVVIVASTAIGVQHWRLAPTAFDAISRGQYQRAAQLFAETAEAGDVQAQLHLGNLYYLGLGVERDYRIAAHWYETAARKNDPKGQYNLALLYHNGLGTTQDTVSALTWFLLARENDNERAEAFLRSIAGTLNPNKVQLARQRQQELQREINRSLK